MWVPRGSSPPKRQVFLTTGNDKYRAVYPPSFVYHCYVHQRGKLLLGVCRWAFYRDHSSIGKGVNQSLCTEINRGGDFGNGYISQSWEVGSHCGPVLEQSSIICS